MKTDNLEIKVLENSPGKLLLELNFDESSGYFEGHFPDFPILPGVIQTHLAVRLFEKYQEQVLPFGGFKLIKFFSPILPKMKLQLVCELNANKTQLSFHYAQGDKVFSRGTMIVKRAVKDV